MKRISNRRIGFTLIELMIVVTIIGILAIIAVTQFADLVRKSKEGQLKGNLGAIRGALNIYYGDMEGYYPSSFSVGTGVNTLEALTINGKYISPLPVPLVPDYHQPNFAFGIEYDSNSSSVAAYFASSAEGIGAPALWLYFDDPTQQATWGQVFVGCQHTDTKGTNWSNY